MSRQDKATTEKHTRMLREMVRRPENKVCADCKRNDPRWASWNIGVFVCIRCSGIHRSMGTHISKVKSVDLDTWTPEQMECIQQWGNYRANLYWEAHLKPGHVPPEHKMESFIRSKYESRRWALEGPPPQDLSMLENGASSAASRPHQPSQTTSTPALVSAHHEPAPPQVTTSRQPRAHHLLSSDASRRPSKSGATPPPQQAPAPAPAHQPAAAPTPPQNDLFSLDFHAPPATQAGTQQAPKKDVKNDILSLFSTPASASTNPPVGHNAFGQFGGGAVAQQPDPFGQWGQQQAQLSAQPPVTSMAGASGTSMWGVQSGWAPPAAQVPLAQPNVWGAQPAQSHQQAGQNLFETQSVWGNPGGGAGGAGGGFTGDMFSSPFATGTTAAPAAQKKDDAFGDLWGGFK